jgi:hypothetical protein
MPKTSNIRWRKKDFERIANVARRFNSKITRLTKANPELSNFYPERINTKDLRSITKRQDFNRTIKSYERFFRKGSEELKRSDSGYFITEWEFNEAVIKLRTLNRRNTIERNKISPSTERGTMGLVEKNNIRNYNLNFNKRSLEEFRRFETFLEKTLSVSYLDEKIKLYKKNYIDSIKRNLADHPYQQILIDLINDLDIDTLIEGASYSPQLQIQFTSLPTNDYNIVAEETLNYWIDFLREKNIESEVLRGF